MTQTIARQIIIPSVNVRELASPRSALPAITLEFLPRTVNIVCYQGDALSLRLTVSDSEGNPANLAGMTPASQIRRRPDDGEILAEFAGFQITGNVVDTGLTSNQMATGHMPAGRWVWDFQVTDPSGEVQTYCAGTFTVVAEVTR